MTTPAWNQLACIYARFSDPKQDARSIDDQIRRGRQYADSNGMQVVETYADHGITGRHSARADFQRLLADAKVRRFKYVLIFDVARFSRSLGTLWEVVFGRLRRLGVVVIDVSTGTRSDSTNARMVFGTMGLVSDLWCQMIGDETRKALEGRARSGFHPGGKTYGYTSVSEPTPIDPQHPRRLRVVEPEEAKIVVLVFTLFTDGLGYRAIAAELNRRGIVAPHDGKRGNKLFDGWGQGTIRYMLRNAEYAGSDRWGDNRWTLLDDGKYEKAPQEDDAKRVGYTVPAIVPPELWERAQARFKKRLGRGPGRHPGTGKHRGWLLSGMVKCGACGGSLTIASRKRLPDGRHYANIGCRTHDNTGGTMCKNNRTISERKIVETVVGQLRGQLASADLVKEFVAGGEARARDNDRAAAGSTNELERRVRACHKRVSNLTESLARTGFSTAVQAQLAKEERSLEEAERCLATAQRAGRPKVVAHPTLIRRQADDLLALLNGDDMPKAREELARHMPPIVLTPVANGWDLTGGFDWKVFLQAGQPGSVEGVGGTGIEPATRAV